MEKELVDMFGDIRIEFMGQGFRVEPAVQANDSGCGSCSGC